MTQEERRIRLLALVETGFVPDAAVTQGPAYAVSRGDVDWFGDNIPCQRACPAGTDVPRYIALLAEGRFDEADEVNRADNVFPGCLGRICARPCEDVCRRQVLDAPVGIRAIKRVAAGLRRPRSAEAPPSPNGLSVAVVGAGVAGLAAARDLADKGYRVAVFERLPLPGGMLRAGVPQWRLPRDIVASEVAAIEKLGVEIHCGLDVGRDVRLEDLLAEHDAVFVATGCQQSVGLGIDGEHLDGVIGGLPYLEAVNLGDQQGVSAGKRVVVVGGGFTSIDCVRSARRQGATNATLVYRRSREEIPVEAEELADTVAEDIEFVFEAAPARILGHEGRVVGLELVRNDLGAPDASGRRRPEPRPGSEFVVPCDQVIVAIGQRQSSDFDPQGLLGEPDRRGVVRFDESQRTRHPRVWVAGDYTANPRNFIAAIADGKRAARAIDATLRGVATAVPEAMLTPVAADALPLPFRRNRDEIPHWSTDTLCRRLRTGDDYTRTPRQPPRLLPVAARRLDDPVAAAPEVDLGLSREAALEEASRCLQCQLNIFIDGAQCILCNGCVEVCPQHSIEMIGVERLASVDGDQAGAVAARNAYAGQGAAMVIDEEACIRCGMCVDWCPTGALTMAHFRVAG